MAGYTEFAQVYDLLTTNVPYDEIAAYYDSKIMQYGGKRGLLLDLGCGTGNLTARLAGLGYDVIGADASQEMLSVAVTKLHEGIQYICQDMTQIDLYGAADVIVSTLDSINHLGCAQDILNCFQRAADNLADGGLFVFDVNTVWKHRNILADNTFIYDVDGVYCAWQNELNPDDSVTITLDLFYENEDGTYSRGGESFAEIALSHHDILKYLSLAGFDTLGVYDYLTDNEPREDSEKLLFIAGKLDKSTLEG